MAQITGSVVDKQLFYQRSPGPLRIGKQILPMVPRCHASV